MTKDFVVEVNDSEVREALNILAERVQNMNPVLQVLGEGIVERSKRRFETSTDPDGLPWKPNSAATLMALGERLLGHRNRKGQRSYAYSKQGGMLNGKGLERLSNKKPLIGESGDLRRNIIAAASNNALTIQATPVYAAIQQFGGKAGRGKRVTIPARPFLSIKLDGTLYPKEQAEILTALNDYLTADL
ncbi:MAG: phage virion morphogenesis protein [Rhodoferax sp.]|nr:phage virion morphogenesis protein [Rhodoferax sp.]